MGAPFGETAFVVPLCECAQGQNGFGNGHNGIEMKRLRADWRLYTRNHPQTEDLILTKWSRSARLETRTKESNVYASL